MFNKKDKIDFNKIKSEEDFDILQEYIEHSYFNAIITFKRDHDSIESYLFEKEHALLIFKDYSKNKNLNSFFFMHNQIEQEEELNYLNFPYSFREKHIKPMLEKNRIFSNKNNNEIIIVTDEQSIPNHIDISQWHESKPSTIKKLSPRQLLTVFSIINSLPESEKKDVLSFYNEERKSTIDQRLNQCKICEPSLEQSCILEFYTKSESVYTKLFKNEHEAYSCYKKIVNNSKNKDYYDFIIELGFRNNSLY